MCYNVYTITVIILTVLFPKSIHMKSWADNVTKNTIKIFDRKGAIWGHFDSEPEEQYFEYDSLQYTRVIWNVWKK